MGVLEAQVDLEFLKRPVLEVLSFDLGLAAGALDGVPVPVERLGAVSRDSEAFLRLALGLLKLVDEDDVSVDSVYETPSRKRE